MDIADVHQLLLPEIHERMALVYDRRPLDELVRPLEELSTLFQGLGLCHLLESLDLTQLAENLCRSGHARRYFLRRAQAEKRVDDRRLALGRTQAALDAIAAGDLALAGDIAVLSGVRWVAAWEYEDDFCFFLFVHRLVLGLNANAAFPPPELAPILARWKGALEGGRSPRLEVCRAFVARSPSHFADALSARLEEMTAELDVERASSAVQEDFDVAFWPRSFVSIEALAMLQLAQMVGIATPRDVPRCPEAARLPVRPNTYRDFFLELDGQP